MFICPEERAVNVLLDGFNGSTNSGQERDSPTALQPKNIISGPVYSTLEMHVREVPYLRAACLQRPPE